jgi:hypothetical protein
MFQDKEKIPLLTAMLASLICLLLYLPALRCGFINYDDPEYVLNNPIIRQLTFDSLTQTFMHAQVGWWMPLTWISLAIDYHYWGLNPVGYHLTNIVLHAVNAGLVVLIADILCKTVARQGTGLAMPGRSYAGLLLITGLFYGVHPLRVESVAWVTERKDVLNGLFAFLSVLFYLSFAGRNVEGTNSGRARIYFFLSLFCFVCSLMAKSVSVVLPAMLVVLDWGPLGRLKNHTFRRLILEKWPFWVASALITHFTFVVAAQSQYLVTYEAFPFTQRVVVSGNAIWEYVRLLLAPIGLSPFNVIPDPIPVAYTVKTVLVVMALVLIYISRISPNIKSAMACFLLPLLPVLAFFQNGDQSFADRFTYLPSLAPTIFLPVVFCYGGGMAIFRRMAIVAGWGVLVVYMAVSVRQIGYWENSETFWTRSINIQPLAITYKERGMFYQKSGRYDAAVADFSAAIGMITPTLKPFEYNFYAFRAESLLGAGHYEDAVRDFTTAIAIRPHPAYFYYRSVALQALGKPDEAAEDLRHSGSAPGPINWFD